MRAQRPLNPAAVQSANEQLWASNPELNRRQLTMAPEDYEYRRQWMAAYQDALRRLAPRPPTSGGSKPIDAPGQQCPGALGGDLIVDVTRVNDGAPLEGAVVSLAAVVSSSPLGGANVTPLQSGVTDRQGRVTFRCLDENTYQVTAAKDNHTTETTTAVVVPLSTQTAHLRLTAEVELRVTVRDRDTNQPIAGASVRLSGPHSEQAPTDAAGNAHFIGIPTGTYRIEAGRAGYVSNHVSQELHQGSHVATLTLAAASVRIRAADGVSNPPAVMPVTGRLQLKAVPSLGATGTYQWSTTSAKITLTNANSQSVTVNAGPNFSAARDAEEIQLVFTPSGGGGPLPPVTHRLTVIKVTFSKSASQRYGYDNMDNAAGVKHHVSVKRNDHTFVRVTIQGGATGEVLHFTPANNAIADATTPGPASAAFDLQVNGKAQDKAETDLHARCNDAAGPICATIAVNVYKEKAVRATVAKIYDSTVAATTLTRPNFDVAAAETVINEWYKPAVASIDLTDHSATGGALDVRYDLNGNGRLELDPGGTSNEEQAIRDAFNPAGQKVVIVKDLAWIFYLKNAAAAGDTTIDLRDAYADSMQFILPGSSYEVGAGATAERVTIASTAGTTVTLAAPLANDHAAGEGLLFPLSGLSGNPIFVAEQGKTEAKERETIGHECAHSLLSWDDLNAVLNLMHHSIGRTGTEIRFKPLPKRYEAGNQNQWDTVSRR